MLPHTALRVNTNHNVGVAPHLQIGFKEGKVCRFLPQTTAAPYAAERCTRTSRSYWSRHSQNSQVCS